MGEISRDSRGIENAFDVYSAPAATSQSTIKFFQRVKVKVNVDLYSALSLSHL